MMHAVSRAPDVAPRIAALVIPDFLIEVSLRVYPSLVGRPVAVADGLSRREIVAMNRAARGVAMGMTPKQARAACPGLVVIARDERSEREAMAELLDALESCSPAVEAIRPGTCCFDVRSVQQSRWQVRSVCKHRLRWPMTSSARSAPRSRVAGAAWSHPAVAPHFSHRCRCHCSRSHRATPNGSNFSDCVCSARSRRCLPRR